ncbi:MAG: TetR/AcrR family transcriptional regulator [Desulfurellaceae bacterium]|nr:TetR/AcrR family transcriptional regulator [Desulfurellaceae bacterium]
MAGLSHADRSELTRRALLDAAQELFAAQGYAATSAVAIARRAKRTQGALQYHFTDKATLFQAVYAEQNAAVLDFIVERMQAADGELWQQTVVAADAYLETVTDTRRLRILYLDAPVVLGRTALHRTGPWLGLLRQLFAPLLATGVIAPLPLNPLIHLVWAALYEAGNYVAYAADPRRAQAEMRTLLLRALDGLRPRPERRPDTG